MEAKGLVLISLAILGSGTTIHHAEVDGYLAIDEKVRHGALQFRAALAFRTLPQFRKRDVVVEVKSSAQKRDGVQKAED
jgi:hypothetical protein